MCSAAYVCDGVAQPALQCCVLLLCCVLSDSWMADHSSIQLSCHVSEVPGHCQPLNRGMTLHTKRDVQRGIGVRVAVLQRALQCCLLQCSS
jgi:hypothetical protein